MAGRGGMSYVLNTLLDSLGLDEDQRQRRMKCQRIKQLLYSWCLKLSDGGYFLLSGSTYETTTIDGLSSDVDIMMVINYARIIEDVKDWKRDNILTYMMDSTDCYKAFVRLYQMSPEYPELAYSIISPDKPCKIVLNNSREDIEDKLHSYNLEQHGPAMTLPESKDTQEMDLVMTLKCESFPRDAAGWKTRQTPLTRTRISPAIIDEINYCYLVPVGNKASDAPHLEWRLSFSHIENELVHNWNSIQYKCYVMMKFIQKDLIKPEVPETLCSYHFKTIMMWMNEEYPSEFFVEENFEQCLLTCLKNLAEVVDRKSLPHYFVDGCNLFYPKLTNDPVLVKKLAKTIHGIISSWPYCLCNIKRCNLGNMIMEYFSQPASLIRICNGVHQKRREEGYLYELLDENYRIFIWVQSLLHGNLLSKCPIDRMTILSHFIQISSQQQGDNETRKFIDIIIKDTLCGIGLELHQQSRSMKNKNALKRLRLGERLIQRYLSSCGNITALMVAADFLITGKYQQVLMSLDKVKKNFKHFTQFLCQHLECSESFTNHSIGELLYDKKPSFMEMFKHYAVGPVTYKQTQISHVPKGLVYEMFRTTTASPFSDPRLYPDWYSQAVIHCPVYLHYLRFLCYELQGHNVHRQIALHNMKVAARYISDSPNTHNETNHNVIGYCYRTVGDPQHAYKEYRKSLDKEKYNNAVLWHMAVLLRNKIRGDQ